ncbi:MAG: DUF1028 domain-containing protein [Solirubrobacterales bacterium]|nr:DUF1028 domain-containing protein [Solirubrobacterales bacterium]
MRQGTYSIVARDPVTGELGVAVHSHWFSVGSLVSWARPGVGAVATQSVVEPAYGPDALERLAAGSDVEVALDTLTAADPLARLRQVGVVDARGRAVAHTGYDCIAHAGHQVGDGFTCQANMMAADTVPQAMAAAFEAAEGDLAARLTAALDGAESVGGDVRGRQSAALLVVPAQGPAWKARVDLRVDDHHDPLAELSRLLGLQRAYELADQADGLMGAGQTNAAGDLYRRATDLAPGSDELEFWAGLALAQGGDLQAGSAAVDRAAAVNPGWRVLLERLSPELAPAGPQVRRALGWD